MDDSAVRGLTNKSEAALHVARALLTDEIMSQLRMGSLDEKALASLLGGGEGADIVLQYFIKLVLGEEPAMIQRGS